MNVSLGVSAALHMDSIQWRSSETTTHEMLFPLRKASQIESNSQRCLNAFYFPAVPPLLSFFFFPPLSLCFFSTPPWFWSEHNVVRSDLTPWQFSFFPKSCEDAEERWAYAAVCAHHETVSFFFFLSFQTFVSVSEGMLQQEQTK